MSTNALSYIDVSSNNPTPDVNAYARDGYKHLCRKVSEGVAYHWQEGDVLTDHAHAAGLHVGHYHWLSEDQDPVAQAHYFVTLVKPRLGKRPGKWPYDGDWLMTDLERSGGKTFPGDLRRAQQLALFNAAVLAALPGYPLLTYTGNWYLDGNPHLQAEARRWPIVMSNYDNIDELPNPYALHYAAWQFSDRARVKGASAPVDLNRWLPTPPMGATSYPGQPNLRERIVLKGARLVVVNALRAVMLGGDHGYFTHERFPDLVRGPNQGVLDRLRALEQKEASK